MTEASVSVVSAVVKSKLACVNVPPLLALPALATLLMTEEERTRMLPPSTTVRLREPISPRCQSVPPLSWIVALLNTPWIASTASQPPVSMVLVLVPNPHATVGVRVAPLPTMMLPLPSELLIPARRVIPDRTSIVPTKSVLFVPSASTIALSAPVELVNVNVELAVTVRLDNRASSVLPRPPVRAMTIVASLETVTRVKMSRIPGEVPLISAANVSFGAPARKSRLE
ncbi:MAG: hypothetical protein PCFJNLEI_04228 [Verrucomicrobiae bacterium]|nr:hypothetical protein [Verrucomicrobiae bacterium]